jgi:hypothetical protein
MTVFIMTDDRQKKQARRIAYVGCFLMLALLGPALAGCGKKPGAVDPPPQVINDEFPRVYPDLNTDPKP